MLQEVSFVEIYNETVNDLLRNTEDADIKYDIKLDAAGNPYITDVTRIPVDPNDERQVGKEYAFDSEYVLCVCLGAEMCIVSLCVIESYMCGKL